jgi:methylglutamate dehydrogenase subunit D
VSDADQTMLIESLNFNAATVMARKAVRHEQFIERIGVELPRGPVQVKARGLRLIGMGPGTWLALSEDPLREWITQLEQTFAGLASISDQSGAYRLFKIVGRHAREVLQRGAFIDLHPEVFRTNAVATTAVGHIGVTFWQGDAEGSFEVAVSHSYGLSFQHWFESATRNL